MSKPGPVETDKSWGIVPIRLQAGAALFLLIQHKAGHWGFPKGHPHAGELPLNTALRELREETGIDDCRVADEFVFSEQYHTHKRGRDLLKSVHYFPALVPHRTVHIDRDEIIDSIWLSLDPALERLTYANSREVLLQVQRALPEILDAIEEPPS